MAIKFLCKLHLPQNPGLSDAGGENLLLSYRTYLIEPSAEWVIFVHGAGARSPIWRRQLHAFQRRWNVLVLDLRGHGRSPKSNRCAVYTFESTAGDILRVMNREKIAQAHFVAMSLGCLLVETLATLEPTRVRSMVLAGGIAKIDTWAWLLMCFGDLTKRFLPYMWLYRLFAWVIMPGSGYRRTRKIFHAQARRLSKPEFLNWYRLTHEVKAVIAASTARLELIPTLFVMGTGDHMFGEHARMRANRRADTHVVFMSGAGHVCNVDQPEVFNQIALDFIEHV